MRLSGSIRPRVSPRSGLRADVIPGDDNTIGAALRTAARRLEAVSGVPRIDSSALLGNVAGLTRAQILARQRDTLDGSLRDRFEHAIRRREAGEPLAYITGRREFWSLALKVTPAALVPRAETELLVDVALRLLGTASARVLDLGTGTGAIAIALAKSRPSLAVTATDVDPAALALARDNARDLGAAVRFVESDWTAALGDLVFNIVVSNPPYVRSDDPHFDGAAAIRAAAGSRWRARRSRCLSAHSRIAAATSCCRGACGARARL